MKRPTLQDAIEWIVVNDDVSVPEQMQRAPVEYLRGLVSIALVADLFGVSARTVASRVRALARVMGRDV